MSVLVIDVGTSSVRASVVDADASVHNVHRVALASTHPFQGMVEFDAAQLARAALAVARKALGEAGSVQGVGIAAQRASTILWDKKTGAPLGPGIGWQDLRTTGTCLALQGRGLRLSPNQSATKLSFLLERFDPKRERELCFGTVESFLAWTISARNLHVTDATNAAVTGLLKHDASDWDGDVLDALHIDPSLLPLIVDSTGILGTADALPGAPAIAGLCGDQQASLIGQGCIEKASAKATFGSGAMLDCCVGEVRPSFSTRGPSGSIPIVAWRQAGRLTWGVEAVMLSAGTCVAWLRDGLGIIKDVRSCDAIAGSVPDAGGITFVPCFSGMGAPKWDFGARGTFVGLSASSSRAEVVRAVLEGIAQRGADLLEAVEADASIAIETLCVDGGMSANSTFVALLAAATGRPIALAPVTEATTLGAAFLAGVGVGMWTSLEDASSHSTPRATIEPGARLDRATWLEMRDRALRTVPALSMLSF
jgi:glycerol kinase